VDILRIRLFVVGEHFAFGHQKSGNVSLLRKIGEERDFLVEGIPEIHIRGARVSSSLIREKIQKGEFSDVAVYMGHPFSADGVVVKGDNVGAQLGIPTANLALENEIVPSRGVHVTRAILSSGSHPAVTNVGFRPTRGGSRLTVETHLIDFSGDLYGQRMEVQFLQKLRDEMRFENMELLKKQILADIARAKDVHRVL
jgi:riboflavin kinase/FMN adenylyltransferase